MKTYLDCYPCFLKQALKAARLSEADDVQQYILVQRTLAVLQNIPAGANPPEIADQIHRIIREKIKNSDPYLEVKQESTQQAMALYPKLKALVKQSANPLDTAIRLSIAGNIIDFAVNERIADLWTTVERVLQQPYAINDCSTLISRLRTAGSVLFLADNAGETVFDRILIEELSVPVLYAVKDQPVINDATMQDAIDAGLDQCSTLISNGSQAAGTILELCSDFFREQVSNAHLIIAKGQANFETLSDSGSNIYCLLQVKCPIIGRDLNVPVGSIVVRQSLAERSELPIQSGMV